MQQLSGQDAMFLHAEMDGFPMHIGGVSIYDQSKVKAGRVSDGNRGGGARQRSPVGPRLYEQPEETLAVPAAGPPR